MKARKIATLVATLALTAVLTACGKGSFNAHMTNEGGIEIDAENATATTAVTAGSLTVKEGDCIVISPVLEKGTVHVTIESGDGKVKVYDQDVSGTVFFTVDADPGTYDVVASANDATGYVAVITGNKEEIAATDASLAEALAEAGFDQEAIDSLTSK